MLIFFTILFLLIVIISMSILKRYSGDGSLGEWCLLISLLCGVGFAICIGLDIKAVDEICIDGPAIKQQIAAIQEENDVIEEKLSTLVEAYQTYEKETYKDFKNTSPEILIQLYPDLKSDALIQEQMSIYMENNKEIKKLKEKEVKVSKWKHRLLF